VTSGLHSYPISLLQKINIYLGLGANVVLHYYFLFYPFPHHTRVVEHGPTIGHCGKKNRGETAPFLVFSWVFIYYYYFAAASIFG